MQNFPYVLAKSTPTGPGEKKESKKKDDGRASDSGEWGHLGQLEPRHRGIPQKHSTAIHKYTDRKSAEQQRTIGELTGSLLFFSLSQANLHKAFHRFHYLFSPWLFDATSWKLVRAIIPSLGLFTVKPEVPAVNRPVVPNNESCVSSCLLPIIEHGWFKLTWYAFACSPQNHIPFPPSHIQININHERATYFL